MRTDLRSNGRIAPMRNLAQSFLVWLMLVAIPFQGVATAGMLTCVTMQAPVAAPMTPEHCAMMADAPQAGDGARGDASTHASAGHHTDAKGSTCAACFGVAMAPTSALPPLPGTTALLAAFPFDCEQVARVDLALPERPPKLR